MSREADVTRLLQSLAEQDEQRWESKSIHWRIEVEAPSLLRLYQAVLREDFTPGEMKFLSTPNGRRQLEKVRKQIWRPSLLELFLYSQGMLDGPNSDDVEYHLTSDGCRRSKRLIQLMESDPGLMRLALETVNGDPRAKDQLEHSLSTAFAAREPFEFAAAPTEKTNATILQDREALLELEVDSDGCCLRFHIGATPSGTLLRISLDDLSPDNVAPKWAGYAMLRDHDRSPIAQLRLAESPPKDAVILARPVSVSELTADELPALEAGWTAAIREDSAAVPVWRDWAAAGLNATGLDESIRTALDRFAGRAV